MNIIEKIFETNGKMNTRKVTERIILHHAEATNCTVEDIDRWHKNNGWCKIGYHFFVDKNGNIYRGREEDKVGAHAGKYVNPDSIGICFEGKYMVETMPEAQLKAGQELVAYLKEKYNIITVQRHSEVCKTSCPGANFPFDEIVNGQSIDESIDENNKNTDEKYTYKQFVGDVQKATGAKVDHIAGKETLSKTVTVSRYKNNRHAVVRAIQSYLNALGFDCGKVDGIAGKLFDNAVKSYQKVNSCVVDGEITARNKTWKKLLKLA